MSDTDNVTFGGVEGDVDGDAQSRKVQTDGRINFPDEYLNHIDVNEGDEVFIGVEGKELVVKKASMDALGALRMMDTVHKVVVGDSDGE